MRVSVDGWWNRFRNWYTPPPVPPPADESRWSAAPAPDSVPAIANGSDLPIPHSLSASDADALIRGITADYKPNDAFDELRGVGGKVAPHWNSVLTGLAALTHEQRLSRIDRINHRVRETGIAHDLFADPSRNLQPWRLDLMPLIFTAKDWAGIEAAVVQRARLLEAVLKDVYGPQTLLERGVIPAQLVFSDPSYLRPCQAIEPKSGRIQFFAVDLTRGTDGAWRVVDTHVETPAGIGYALANRTVLTHVSGDLFSASKAVRVAPFFRQMQTSLRQRANRRDPSIALLSPGPHHNDFFSHSFLARYLGLLLVEGEDLRVDQNRVHLKTVDGLQPIDVIVRCVAAAASDALELEPSGFLGPVGLVQAARRNPDLVVNALGTALAENRGLGGYMPAMCKHLLGEELQVWDVEKWWLGDAKARATVMANLDRYFIRGAYETTARPGRAAAARDPELMSADDRRALIAEIELNGAALVAEEKVALGTAPSYGAHGLEPKPFAIRVFATAVAGGFAVMPGGLAMTVNPGGSMAVTSTDTASRDVWVLSDEAQPAFQSLLRPAITTAHIERTPHDLPSRAADNLFWLGRYIENVDWTFRVLRNCLGRIEADVGPRMGATLMRALLNDMLDPDSRSQAVTSSDVDPSVVVEELANRVLTSTDRVNALPQTLGRMHQVASLTRDRLSNEAWRTLNAFYSGRRWEPHSMPSTIGESLDLIDTGLGVVAAFNGLSHENMTRNFGWSFLDMGRRSSRALNLSRMLRMAFVADETGIDDGPNALFALELADSFITYRSRYRLDPMLPLVLDLLIVDETNPRSLAYQLAHLSSHIERLPQGGKGRDRTDIHRMASSMLEAVRQADIATLALPPAGQPRPALGSLLTDVSLGFPSLIDAITRRYFSVVEKEPRWIRAQSRTRA